MARAWIIPAMLLRGFVDPRLVAVPTMPPTTSGRNPDIHGLCLALVDWSNEPGKPKLIRHRVSIANGPVIDSLSELFIFPNNVVTALGEAGGASTVTGAAKSYRVAAGASTGASLITGAAIRRAVPTGATAGTSAVAGAAIRRAVAAGALVGAGGITGQGKRIVWTIGTLTGAASLVEGVPTTRIFAPAWGNSSLTGDSQVSYVAQASAFSPAIVMGLGGYVLVGSAETLAGTSAASSIEGANLKAGAGVCDGISDLAGATDSLLAGASTADGSCDAKADTQVVFVAGGVVLAGDGFDLDGNPQPSSTSAYAGATTHAGAGAAGGSRVVGSAPTPVPASGTITGSSDTLYLEVLIYGAEELQGLSTTDAIAGLRMRPKPSPSTCPTPWQPPTMVQPAWPGRSLVAALRVGWQPSRGTKDLRASSVGAALSPSVPR